MAERLIAYDDDDRILKELDLAETLAAIGPTGTPSSTTVLHGDGSWS